LAFCPAGSVAGDFPLKVIVDMQDAGTVPLSYGLAVQFANLPLVFFAHGGIIEEREAAQRSLIIWDKELPLLSRRFFLLIYLDDWRDYHDRNRQYLNVKDVSSPPSATSTAAIADGHNAYIGSNGSELTAGACASHLYYRMKMKECKEYIYIYLIFIIIN
jgi:hypothetical protein